MRADWRRACSISGAHSASTAATCAGMSRVARARGAAGRSPGAAGRPASASAAACCSTCSALSAIQRLDAMSAAGPQKLEQRERAEAPCSSSRSAGGMGVDVGQLAAVGQVHRPRRDGEVDRGVHVVPPEQLGAGEASGRAAGRPPRPSRRPPAGSTAATARSPTGRGSTSRCPRCRARAAAAPVSMVDCSVVVTAGSTAVSGRMRAVARQGLQVRRMRQQAGRQPDDVQDQRSASRRGPVARHSRRWSSDPWFMVTVLPHPAVYPGPVGTGCLDHAFFLGVVHAGPGRRPAWRMSRPCLQSQCTGVLRPAKARNRGGERLRSCEVHTPHPGGAA